MDPKLAAACTPLVLRSRGVVLLALVVELALITPRTLTEAPTWAVLGLGLGLGHVGILAALRRIEAGPRAVRRVLISVTVIVAGLVGSAVFGLLGGARGLDGLALVAAAIAVMTVAPAAVGYAAIEGSLPEQLRDPQRGEPRRPSLGAGVGLACAWLTITLAGSWLLTGLTGDTSCEVDGACSFGIPLRFARFGERGGGSSLDWGRFAQDLGMFATLVPAAWASFRLRPRWPFVVYLLVIGGWIAWVALSSFGGASALRLWMALDLLELGSG